MIVGIYSCHYCVAPKRHPGCHDHCPEYAKEKAKHDKEKAIADEQKRIQAGLTAQALVGVNKANKLRRKAKGL